ncbi:coproporphyrinogen III oxidase [Escherichia coli]
MSQRPGRRWQREDWRRRAWCAGVFRNGGVFEQAGVNFSHVHRRGDACFRRRSSPEKLPGAVSRRWAFRLVVHPHNPYVPTSHAECIPKTRVRPSGGWRRLRFNPFLWF